MDAEEFRRYGREVVDRVADYMKTVEKYPVLPRIQPGEIREQLPPSPPADGEPMEAILADFESIIMPGVTHWNHPRFFGYFPANHSGPAILGEILSAGLGVNGMVWQSCPAATELEEVVMEWVAQLLDLPPAFRGTIHDTASTASLCALLCARELTTGFGVNARGPGAWAERGDLRVYVSSEAHSSIEKGAKIAGFGAQNVVTVDVNENFAMDPAALEERILADRKEGRVPCCIVATVGTTSSTAIDPIGPIGAIARKHDLWLHIDAALAGSAAILPEKRHLIDGIEQAHSFVFNPHKWLFTNFDCSAFYCSEPDTLVRTLTIMPEYLKTVQDERVINYRDWGIPLGRRFRSLKLWFVLRSFGVEGLRNRLRAHIALAKEFERWVDESDRFEVMAPVPVQTVCFRFNPFKGGEQTPDEARLEEWNTRLRDEVNASGRIFITHTSLGGRFCLRLSVGQIQTGEEHVAEAWRVLCESPVVEEVGRGG